MNRKRRPGPIAWLAAWIAAALLSGCTLGGGTTGGLVPAGVPSVLSELPAFVEQLAREAFAALLF